ncbi:hypothetical protein [Thalassotalea euphylliae]|uniref:Uncharacterized protein n=1 Tax=Thalassotalea euphylliae TaxID=1655234 RepID=A0A3E0UCY0_9GAMM|nr:hypothetical protein [Thalassotalea euphylliae]REL34690.1 hypothetical protein DXX92_04585 [Thalassotalea euphylliae]
MNYLTLVEKPALVEKLINQSSSPYKQELAAIVRKAIALLKASKLDESEDNFNDMLEMSFDSALNSSIDANLVELSTTSELLSDAMFETKGFTHTQAVSDVLYDSLSDPLILTCNLIHWCCQQINDNLTDIQYFHKIQLVYCQLNWLFAANISLHYAEDRFFTEDKNRTKVKPYNEYAYRVVQALLDKGHQLEELAVVSSALITQLQYVLDKFNNQEKLTEVEFLAFDRQPIPKQADNTNQLSSEALKDRFESKWDNDFGRGKWRWERKKSGQFVLLTAKSISYFLDKEQNKEKKLSAALRNKLSLKLKSGPRTDAVLAATRNMLSKAWNMHYDSEQKKFIKS